MLVIKPLLWLRYRVVVSGRKAVAKRGAEGILFLPNHPALIDPVIIQAVLRKPFKPRALADQDQVDRPIIRTLARKMRILEIPDPARQGAAARELIDQAVRRCVEALKAGDNLVLYPSGHTYRSRYEDLRGNTAVETIIKQLPDVRVVLVRTRGLWGSGFSWAGGHAPNLGRVMRRGLAGLLLSGLLFGRRRRVTVELHEPADLPRHADRETLNGFMEAFYNEDAPPNTYVPFTPWQGGGPREMPEPQLSLGAAEAASVPETTRKIVTDYLHELTGRSSIADDQHLARDLGLDSLARADMIVWVEGEFGFPQGDADALQTVADVMLAACGESIGSQISQLKPIPAKWQAWRTERKRVIIPPGPTLCEAFLTQAQAAPNKPVLADQNSGVRTYRNVVTGIFALRKHIAALPGQRVGIMLPASVGAAVVYMATLFAGKTPVMVNWTVGRRNVLHGLDLVGVEVILTAQALVSKLTAQGADFTGLDERFVYLEEIGKTLGTFEKIGALLKAIFAPKSLLDGLDITLDDAAVILFTSGSESLPKAVPLTHGNIGANLTDVAAAVWLGTDDCMMSILPPFHSFGLTVGVLAPLCGGFCAVYYPNPTEAPMLVRLIDAYKASFIIGTPTFLAGIVRAAGEGQMQSLRWAVTGGEKCPDRTYDALNRQCPEMAVVEGYGVTECSPLVSVNDPDAPKAGTIGKLLGSLDCAIVDAETARRRVEPGQTGMLILRGPSVFGGYLHHDGASPYVEFEGHQWYRTGDLVWADDDGVLTFAGRLKRFVKMGGEMISLPAVESVLLEHHASDDDEGPVLAVEATPSEDHPELVLFTTLDLTREQVNDEIRAAGLSALHNIRRIVAIDEIPVLGTGKTNYRALKDRLGEG